MISKKTVEIISVGLAVITFAFVVNRLDTDSAIVFTLLCLLFALSYAYAHRVAD
jgi:uncharacterized membrane protein